VDVSSQIEVEHSGHANHWQLGVVWNKGSPKSLTSTTPSSMTRRSCLPHQSFHKWHCLENHEFLKPDSCQRMRRLFGTKQSAGRLSAKNPNRLTSGKGMSYSDGQRSRKSAGSRRTTAREPRRSINTLDFEPVLRGLSRSPRIGITWSWRCSGLRRCPPGSLTRRQTAFWRERPSGHSD
jgi:hypothetical protein